MKFIKRFIYFIVILFICAIFVNAKTDFFYNISTYIPVLSKYPLTTKVISDLSKSIADITSMIPTPSEIMATLRNEELPIDPEDVASNAYISDSPMLTFYPHENISVMLDEDNDYINIFGMVANSSKRHLIITFSDSVNQELDQVSISCDTSNHFNKKVPIPHTEYNTLKLSVFAGPKEFGQFTSWVLNVITLIRDENGLWAVQQSPVYENNKFMYEKDKSISEALKSTPSIQSDNPSIKALAIQIASNYQSDYDKALAIHDWICSNIYYDEDNLNSGETIPYYATDVINNQKAVCLGFATLYAALCRSIDIPCNVVSGYALGIGEDIDWSELTINTDYQNHAWNEVYVENRWVIVDTTWDTQNKIQSGEWITGSDISHLYFDSNLQFFSQNHKIIEYTKRR